MSKGFEIESGTFIRFSKPCDGHVDFSNVYRHLKFGQISHSGTLKFKIFEDQGLAYRTRDRLFGRPRDWSGVMYTDEL
jgi:hypothetical protein